MSTKQQPHCPTKSQQSDEEQLVSSSTHHHTTHCVVASPWNLLWMVPGVLLFATVIIAYFAITTSTQGSFKGLGHLLKPAGSEASASAGRSLKSYKHSHFDEEDEEEELGLESIHKGTKKSSKKKFGPLGVWLLAKGGVSFGNNFNALKVDGAAGAEAIILGGTLNGNNDDGVSGLAVRNGGTAVICNADQIKGATDGYSGVNSGGGGYTLNIAKANISGGDGCEKGCGLYSVGGYGLYNDSGGTTTIAGKKVNIIGGIYPIDNHIRARAIYNKGTLVVLEAGAIGDEKTPVSLTNIGGEVDIYGGRDWNKNGKWENEDGGTFRVHGKKLDFDSDTKTITGQLCNGYKLHVVVEGDIIFDSNCDAYDDFNGFEECKNDYNPYE